LSALPPPVGQILRASAFTPAVRGYPGGIADTAAEQDEITAGAPGTGSGTVWQQSLEVWREAGIDWLRQGPSPEDLAAIEAEEHNTEPIPVVPAFDPPAGTEAPADDEVLLTGAAAETTSAAPEPAASEPAAAESAAAETGSGATPVAAATTPAREAAVAANVAQVTAAGARAVPGGPGRSGRSRRIVLVAAITSVGLVAGAIAGIAIAGSGGSSAFGLVTPYPPAALAGDEFAARTAGPGLPPTLTGIAGAGETVVAVGSRGGPAIPLPLFLVSRDGGRTWARAAVEGGTVAPALGAVPVLVAPGRGSWLALGQHAAWTSDDGMAWQPAPGVPMSAGDRILGLARTHFGFIAVGENVPGPAGSGVPGPVLWISSAGRTWQRKSGAALSLNGGLDAGGGSVLSLRWAAYRAGAIVVGGEISRPLVRHRGKRKTITNVESRGLWRSTNGGATWHPVTIPVSRGAGPGLAGLAASGSVFVAIRPGRTHTGRRDAVAFVSGTGATWRYAGRLTAGRRSPLRVITVAGSGQGFAVSGTTGAYRVAFFSAGGRGWHMTANQGRYSRTIVAGVTVAPGSVVVAAGAERRSGSGAASAAPYLLRARAGPGAVPRRSEVGQAVLAAAASTEVTVNDLAVAGGERVAAGSADGTPALWWAATGGHWAPAAVSVPASWTSGGLASVARGGAGWLAVGDAGALGSPVAPAPSVPVIMTSANGRAWHPAPGAGPLAARGTSLAQAAAGPMGYVVVGSAAGPGGTQGAAAWHSAGLGTWGRAAVAGVTGQAGMPGQMLAVTAGRFGFLAVGAAGGVPAVWTSPGGSSWRPTTLPLPAGAASAVLTKVAAAGGRVVAVGSAAPAAGAAQEEAAVPFAAVSTDGGRTWRETILHGPGPSAVTALTAAGSGFVAAGVTGAAGNQAAICWWSPNGHSWQRGAPLARGPGSGVTQLTALSARDGVLSGAGYAVTPAGEHPVSWVARYR
jgi:hypothetical protein